MEGSIDGMQPAAMMEEQQPPEHNNGDGVVRAGGP